MQRERPRSQGCDSGDSQWLTAYADLISAVLAVVVLMLTFAPVDLDELTNVVVVQHPVSSDETPTQPLAELKAELEAIAGESGVADRVVFRRDDRGLEVSIESVALFEVGSAELDTRQLLQFAQLFRRIAEVARTRYIDIEGHTDDTGSRELNWRLSSERALSMLRYLESVADLGSSVRIIAYADRMPRRPVEGLDGAELEAARSANRRISLLINRRVD